MGRNHAPTSEGGLSRIDYTGISPCPVRTYNVPKLRFSAPVGEEPEIEVGLGERLRACWRWCAAVLIVVVRLARGGMPTAAVESLLSLAESS
jgi:hypothetical protein